VGSELRGDPWGALQKKARGREKKEESASATPLLFQWNMNKNRPPRYRKSKLSLYLQSPVILDVSTEKNSDDKVAKKSTTSDEASIERVQTLSLSLSVIQGKRNLRHKRCGE